MGQGTGRVAPCYRVHAALQTGRNAKTLSQFWCVDYIIILFWPRQSNNEQL
jgi:hypothetical protein